MDPRNQSPFHSLPAPIVWLAVAMIAIEVGFQLSQAGLLDGLDRIGAIGDWAVMDPVWGWMIETGQWPVRQVARFVTYPFLHGGFGHAAMAAVFVLALGNVVGDVVRGGRLLALFLGPAVIGALVFVVVFDSPRPLLGGYAGAYGLIGAFTWLVRMGATRFPIEPQKAFLLLGFLLAIQPIFGLMSGGFGWVPEWIAEGAAAGAGYLLVQVLVPGGGRRLLDRTRRR